MQREATIRPEHTATGPQEQSENSDPKTTVTDAKPSEPKPNVPVVRRIESRTTRSTFHAPQQHTGAGMRRPRSVDDEVMFRTAHQGNRLETLGLKPASQLRGWIQVEHLFNDRGICVLCHLDEKEMCSCAGT